MYFFAKSVLLKTHATIFTNPILTRYTIAIKTIQEKMAIGIFAFLIQEMEETPQEKKR